MTLTLLTQKLSIFVGEKSIPMANLKSVTHKNLNKLTPNDGGFTNVCLIKIIISTTQIPGHVFTDVCLIYCSTAALLALTSPDRRFFLLFKHACKSQVEHVKRKRSKHV